MGCQRMQKKRCPQIKKSNKGVLGQNSRLGKGNVPAGRDLGVGAENGHAEVDRHPCRAARVVELEELRGQGDHRLDGGGRDSC